jgi:hypothetical protein
MTDHSSETDGAVTGTAIIGRLQRVHYGAVILTFACILDFAGLRLLRSGAPDGWFSVIIVFGLLSCSIWLPTAALLRSPDSEIVSTGTLAAASALGLFIPIIGILSPHLGMAIAVAGLLLPFLVTYKYRAIQAPSSWGWTLLDSVALAILIIVAGAGARFFLPESVPLGIGPADNYFHAAIAHMIASHWRASIGADGLVYHHYYFLSHAVAAGTALSSGLSVIAAYTYWGAISLKAQVLWAIFISTNALTNSPSLARPRSAWMGLAYAWLIMMITRSLESESFVLAMAMFAAALPLYSALLDQRASSSGKSMAAWLIVAIAVAFLCAATKASVGFYCAGALAAAALHLRRSWLAILLLGLGLAGLAGVIVLYLSPYDNVLLDAGWRVMLLSYFAYLDWTAVLSFLLPGLMVLVAILGPSVSWSGETKQFTARYPTTLREIGLSGTISRIFQMRGDWQLVAFYLAGTILVGVSLPIGANLAYFSLVLLIAALMVLPSLASAHLGFCSNWKMGRRFLTLATVATALVSLMVVAVQTGRSVAAIYSTAYDMNKDPTLAGKAGASAFFASLEDRAGTLGHLYQRTPDLPWYRLISDIEKSDRDYQGDLVVNVRPSAIDFWSRLKPVNPWWCYAPHTMIPAETGVAQIRSIAPKSIEDQCGQEGLVLYGFGRLQDQHRAVEMSNAELCTEAKKAGASHVYIVEQIAPAERNSVLDCNR